ncbi:MAG: metal-dependent transcriptional regulator [Thermoanaerobaculaceae bacterium]
MADIESAATTWRAFEANEVTHSAAHYLLAIASFTRKGIAPRSAHVARELGISRAAASLQLQSLRERGLVEMDARQQLHLTRAGADLVARIASMREVVRVFFEEILGVRPQVAALDACKVEHLLSEETGAAIIRLLRFLRSAHPAAQAAVQAFRETTAACEPQARCDMCANTCLLAAGNP